MGICAFLLAVLATGCTDRRPAPTSEPYVIRRDGGGQLISAEADRADFLRWGGEIQIRGYCASACVIFTTLPNACIGRGIRIGFHGSNINMGLIGNRQMAAYLRGAAKQKYLAEWQHIAPTDMHWISAQEYQALDPEIRICPRKLRAPLTTI